MGILYFVIKILFFIEFVHKIQFMYGNSIFRNIFWKYFFLIFFFNLFITKKSVYQYLIPVTFGNPVSFSARSPHARLAFQRCIIDWNLYLFNFSMRECGSQTHFARASGFLVLEPRKKVIYDSVVHLNHPQVILNARLYRR